jgi:hypothetical protein
MPPFAGSIPAAPAIFFNNRKSLFYFMFLCESESRGTLPWYPVVASSNNLNPTGQDCKRWLLPMRFFHRVMHSILTTGAGLPKLALHHVR